MRLLISYTSIAVVLALAGWFTLATLPLVGSAQVKMEALANSKEAHGILASIDVSALPEPLRSAVWEKVQTFQGQPFSNYLMRQIEKAFRQVDSHIGLSGQRDKDGTATALTLFLSPPFFPAPPFDVPRLEPHLSSQTAYQFPDTGKPRILLGEGAAAEKVVHKVDPVYPPQAEVAHIRGTALLDVLIGSDGSVAAVHLSHGHPALAQSAIDAVKQWTYKPTTVGGNPVEVVTQVRVPFGT
jgi:TonB family protein